jgi:glycosyltransferase involved in cell wall biosynthesis
MIKNLIHPMSVQMAYGGGVPRGWQIARHLEKMGLLSQFYTSWRWNENHFPELTTIDRLSFFYNVMMVRTRKYRGAHFADRIKVCDFVDKRIAMKIKDQGNLIVAESHIAKNIFEKGKSYGLTRILDRTNSHISHQSEVISREYDECGIKDVVYNCPKLIEKALQEYDLASYITVLSTYTKKTFIDNGVPEHKLLLINSGIDTEIFSTRPILKNDKKFRVIFSGGLVLKKGVHKLVQAFDELNLPNSELLLIGPLFDEVAPSLAKIKTDIKVLPLMSQAELAIKYSTGSIFVIPSLEEGLPKVMLEAMACGLVVIASKAAGAEDVIDDKVDGFILEDNSIDDLKKAMIYAYENPDEIEYMSELAVQKIGKKFTLDEYRSRWVNVIAGTLNAVN